MLRGRDVHASAALRPGASVSGCRSERLSAALKGCVAVRLCGRRRNLRTAHMYAFVSGGSRCGLRAQRVRSISASAFAPLCG